jgi:hypothetical protein
MMVCCEWFFGWLRVLVVVGEVGVTFPRLRLSIARLIPTYPTDWFLLLVVSSSICLEKLGVPVR